LAYPYKVCGTLPLSEMEGEQRRCVVPVLAGVAPQIYRTRTRLIAFDKKWIGLETVFETGPLASPVTHAVGFCRVVVKESSGSQKGKTVSPEDVFRRIGLEESDVAALKVEHLRDVKKCLCSY